MIAKYIACVLIGIIIHIIYDMWIDKQEWRKTCIEVELDRCCDNAYNYGFEMGKRKAWEDDLKLRGLIDEKRR